MGGTSWIEEKRETLEKDILQDFCLFSRMVDGQCERFGNSGTISFPALHEMVGDLRNKGPLWRLKDAAHHVFCVDREDTVSLLLDWTLGYAFHEALKLMEDAHLHQSYIGRLSRLGIDSPRGACIPPSSLDRFRVASRNSIRTGLDRIQELLAHSRSLFCSLFSGRSGHLPLARFIHDRNELVREVFGEDYEKLIEQVYGGNPEQMHIQAARSLLISARPLEARLALTAALVLYPANEQITGMLRDLEAEENLRPV